MLAAVLWEGVLEVLWSLQFFIGLALGLIAGSFLAYKFIRWLYKEKQEMQDERRQLNETIRQENERNAQRIEAILNSVPSAQLQLTAFLLAQEGSVEQQAIQQNHRT